ncbi:hypothetical protein [Filimonas effusa]|uniref:VWA domain-containing protein n=1 Tax=Filimonas effusa TaxID=2508721 RepID=A0A4Q1DE11_9BACT|nr:hypothetical protein [Filimonas effusa]RXK87135.1 hypothetical protein ESB13_10255 [Filimonas effusa]
MKKRHCFSSLPMLLCCLVVNAQQNRFTDSILDNRILKIPAYELPVIGSEHLLLQMPYAQSSFSDTTGIAVLQQSQVLSVDLLFSDYPSASDLKPLNRSRLQALCQLVPGIEQQPGISWSIIRQTNGIDKPSAEKLIHGFVINYRRNYTPADAEKEMEIIEAAVPGPPATPPPAEPPQKLNHWAIIHRTDSYTKRFYNNQPVKDISNSREKLATWFRPGDSIVVISVREAYAQELLPRGSHYAKENKDSVYLLIPGKRKETRPDPPTLAEAAIPLFPPDSTIHKSLNPYTVTNALIVMDVTGSMAPYIAQMLQWIDARPPSNTISYLVCFNDGDNKADDQKKPGKTGGIYGEKFQGTQHAKALVKKAMQAGNGGGDIQENACEALLSGLHNAPSCKDVLLIADSWAPIRDTVLISNISKPVHVIVCGKRLGVHPDYITLALKTGGTLHFPDAPLVNLQPLLEGKDLMIHQRTYYYANGRVHLRVK